MAQPSVETSPAPVNGHGPGAVPGRVVPEAITGATVRATAQVSAPPLTAPTSPWLTTGQTAPGAPEAGLAAAEAAPGGFYGSPNDIDASLVLHHGRWTAQRALAELPDTPAAAIEVIDGSLIVSPRRGIRHQTTVLEFGIVLKRAARAAGYGTHPQVKIVVGDELVCPDLTVATRLGEQTSCVAAHEVLLVVEVVLTDRGRTGRMDRTPIYAAGKIGHYLRLEFRDHDPVISLHELIDGGYRPVAVAGVGARFATSQPFPFDVDPVELRGRLIQQRTR